MIHIPYQMLSSAGSIVAVPDTATAATVYTRRFGMRFGRIYRNRTGYCTTLYTMRYAMYNALRHIYSSTLYTTSPRGVAKATRSIDGKVGEDNKSVLFKRSWNFGFYFFTNLSLCVRLSELVSKCDCEVSNHLKIYQNKVKQNNEFDNQTSICNGSTFLELSRLLLRFETLYRISTMKFTWKSCVNCDSIVFFTQICVLASI